MPFDYNFMMRIEPLSRWFCGWSRIEPKVGGSFKFGGETCIIPPEGRSWETTIDQGEVLRRFAFRWPIQGAETRVSYDLDDGPGETAVLRAQHRGLPTLAIPGGSLQDLWRSEEHTSELQSQFHLVCRLLLEKKKKHNSTFLIRLKKKKIKKTLK